MIDAEFQKEASKSSNKERGWLNEDYCSTWGGRPTAAAFARWKAAHPLYRETDVDDALVSFEVFASLPRVRPGITDSVAAERRRQYRVKKRHAADMEGEEDACNKAFSVLTGLTQGVFNVVCPHFITLGFMVLFRAESVGQALSIVLERFPRLPKVIFYDVACKIDKNATRRVRPILRDHNVRCILDRPHSITHGCSPVYMPDQSSGATSGVATQAAEVSHSISAANRTSLAYMSPTTYIIHRILQVAQITCGSLPSCTPGSRGRRTITSPSPRSSIAGSPTSASGVRHACVLTAACWRVALSLSLSLLLLFPFPAPTVSSFLMISWRWSPHPRTHNSRRRLPLTMAPTMTIPAAP